MPQKHKITAEIHSSHFFTTIYHSERPLSQRYKQ